MLSVAEVGKLFDDDTRKAIASGLCVRCRAAKLLCGKPRCPILVQYDSMMKTKPLIDDTALDGSSPPGVFVGRFGYPKVFVGPLIPPVHGDTEVLDTPEEWIGRSLEEIVGFRSQLVRGMHRTHVLDVAGGGKVMDLTRELALSSTSTDVEAEFARKPRGRLVLDEDVQPFGPAAPMAVRAHRGMVPEHPLESPRAGGRDVRGLRGLRGPDAVRVHRRLLLRRPLGRR